MSTLSQRLRRAVAPLTLVALLALGCTPDEAPPTNTTPAYDEASSSDESIDDALDLEEMRAMSEETRRQIEAMQPSDDEGSIEERHAEEFDAARREADSLHQALVDQINS